MSQAVSPSLNRIGIVGLFAVSGGAIGGLLVLLGMIVQGAFQQQATHSNIDINLLFTVPTVIIWTAVFGTISGFVPALTTGIVYAALPSRFQKLAVAPVVGSSLSGAYVMLMGYPTLLATYMLAGAGAAFICAAIARKFRIDWIGASSRNAPPPA